MANGEPVNERPLLPSLYRTDEASIGHWSVDMQRQLITIFQQYGYRINQSVTTDELATELANVLRDGNLAENGGTIPETDRVNDFDFMPEVGGDPIVERGSNANGAWVRWADGTQQTYQARTVVFSATDDSTYTTNTLPATFLTGTIVPTFTATNSAGSGTRVASHAVFPIGGTQVDFRFTTTASNSATWTVYITSFGRWK